MPHSLGGVEATTPEEERLVLCSIDPVPKFVGGRGKYYHIRRGERQQERTTSRIKSEEGYRLPLRLAATKSVSD